MTPMACVNRINRVEIPSFELTDHRLPISVDIELEGIGNWNGTFFVFISSAEELLAARANAAKASSRIKQDLAKAPFGSTPIACEP